jgi:hypothetical protein
MKRLKTMRINFAEHGERVSLSGTVVLLLGAGVMMLSIGVLQDILARTALIEARLGQLKVPARTADAGAGGARAAGDAVKRANAVARELARRWDSVFLAIESASDPEVALLAIEPDAGKGLVRITAEARNKVAMLRYVTRLQSRQPLQRVLLERHEVRLQEPERPVRFIVAGGWGEAQ